MRKVREVLRLYHAAGLSIRAIARPEIGEAGNEHLGPVAGVRCVVTGHTPVREPVWHKNVLGIDTGVHIDSRGSGRLTIARIDGKEIETASFARCEE